MATKSVGANLRDAREKQGFSLDDIGARTRITEKCLTAIEQDDVSKLSSPFFYKSFVRQYAEQVGLDYNQLSRGVDQLASTMREPDLPGQGEYPPVRVAPVQPRLKRNFTWVVPAVVFFSAVAVISSGYAAWRYQAMWLNDTALGTLMRNLKTSQGGTVTSTSELKTNDTSATRTIAANVPKAPPQDSEADAKVKSADADVVAAVSDSVAKAATPKTPDVAGDGVTAVSVPDGVPKVDGAIHLELAATERTWLSVVADGKQAYSGIMEKEQVKVLDGQETAEIRTGNAAGVNITFNGRQLGAIGPRGTTRKVIFTKTGFEVFPQAKNHPVFERGTRIGG